MRIAVSGAQGTGKTTLAGRLAEELRLPLIPECSRQVAQRLGIEHLSQLSVDGFASFGKLCMESQLELEQKHSSFVSDRCTLDNAVYWLKWLSEVRPTEETESLVNRARGNMANYDYLFYLPVEFSPPWDGFRSTSGEYQKEVESYFINLLDSWDLEYHSLSGDVEKRFGSALRVLAATEGKVQPLMKKG